MSPENAANVLGALSFALGDDLERTAAEADLDGASAAAVVHLSKYPGRRIDELRVPTALTHSGCVRLVDRLAERGEVERRAGPDGRSVAVYLTTKGRRAAEAQLARRRRSLATALLALNEEEREELGRLAGKVLRSRVAAANDALRVCRLCDYGACKECPCAPLPTDEDPA
jgi:DNA-binding MarR family transcriptional regulator